MKYNFYSFAFIFSLLIIPFMVSSQSSVNTITNDNYSGLSILGEVGGTTTTGLFLSRSTDSQDSRIRFNQNNAALFTLGGNYWDMGMRNSDEFRITNTVASGFFPFTTTYEEIFYSNAEQTRVEGTTEVRLRLDGTTKFRMDAGGIAMGESQTDRTDFTFHHAFGSVTDNGLTIENNGEPGGPNNSNRWNFYVNNSGGTMNLGFNGASVGTFATSGTYTGSDRKLKTGITNVSSVLQNVMLLKPQKYVYKSDRTEKETMGFIAQDFAKQFPELVLDGTDGDDKDAPMMINYGGVGVIAIKAIQEQQQLIDELTKQLEALKATVAELQK